MSSLDLVPAALFPSPFAGAVVVVKLEMEPPRTTAPSPSRTACFLFTVLFAASPERKGAGLLHKEDVAVEAMDHAALLPLLQAIPRCSFHHLVVASRARGEH
jgi:hypothetical protein